MTTNEHKSYWSDLFDEDGLEGDEHEEREEAVVPVLIDAPQAHTEHLEHKEGSRRSLPEQSPEVWRHHVQPAHMHTHV